MTGPNVYIRNFNPMCTLGVEWLQHASHVYIGDRCNNGNPNAKIEGTCIRFVGGMHPLRNPLPMYTWETPAYTWRPRCKRWRGGEGKRSVVGCVGLG
jgi:hypothetical protein